ncbi:unnamed protein product [Tuber melanosporum]|uniref:(Perigord truffle) hypothetical protein n=1 Tax=Tuber melanosporum (strain Mel28) TaxID=656061 RepID=D5G815_TUBMM|nr:uncharacterized protein GSTUM_00002704001 [Tuber melanosporum]CAZ80658.1 unnamed protein product [Tuber melanosporum]
MLLAMHQMTLLAYLMSESSNELSEAMIEYGRVFQARMRADPTLSTDQIEDNARFRCYTHASKFWSDMSSMQMAVHQTLLKDYQQLNHQVAGFFEHYSSDVGDHKVIGDYDKMLRRAEMVADFRFPADSGHARSEAPEGAHRNSDYRKHARSRPQSAWRRGCTYVPRGACPVSGLTHGQIPHPLESPATYPGVFSPRWGEANVQISQTLREASTGDQRFETLPTSDGDPVMSFAKRHSDALRNLETDFLARIAVGLTNTSLDGLKDAYCKADDYASVLGLQVYANHLLGKGQTELYGSLEPNPPRAEDGGDESESKSESDDPVSDGSAGPKDSGPGPNGPGRNNPRPPGGGSGSNFAGGASAGGHSNNSARGLGGSRSSANANSPPSYSSSEGQYEGNRRLSEGLQASLSKQTIYELSDNESPSVNSDSPSVLSRNSLSTTQTSLGSDSDLPKSPKGSSPEVITSVSSETGTAKVALSKDGNQNLSGTTFGIDMPMVSKIVEGLGSRVAQAQNYFVNPLGDTPMALSTLLEDSDEGPDQDSIDDHKVIHTGRKHRHLRRVPRFIIFQGGNLKVFGRHNSYTGTGLKAGSPSQGKHSLQGYQRLGSSVGLPALSACDAVPQSASRLGDLGSNDSTTYGPESGLFQKSACVQDADTTPNKTQQISTTLL